MSCVSCISAWTSTDTSEAPTDKGIKISDNSFADWTLATSGTAEELHRHQRCTGCGGDVGPIIALADLHYVRCADDQGSRVRSMQDKPVKVQAREVRQGDLVVGSRTSPITHGALIKDTWRDGNNRVVAAVDAGKHTWTPRQEIYIFRPQ